MNPLRLKEVHNLASKLFWAMDSTGDIFPPAGNCRENDDCWLFIRDIHRTTHSKIERLLSRIILDSEKPQMSIEEQFFVRERLRFAMFLSECINPECEDMDAPHPISKDVKIHIEGVSTEHFLMWLVDFVFWRLGESDLQCKAYDRARKSRELGLKNSRWMIMREDPFPI